MSLSSGSHHTCGLAEDGTIRCWGNDAFAEEVQGEPPPSNADFVQVSAAYWHSCFLRADGRVECWGDDTWGQLDVPDDRFSQVSAGGFRFDEGHAHTCGVTTDGAILCWGSDQYGESSVPEQALDLEFQEVGCGYRATCGLTTTGEVACWGDLEFNNGENDLMWPNFEGIKSP